MYYFKSMNIADNMKRIVGLLSRKTISSRNVTFAHSYLVINDPNHVIDNTFSWGRMEDINNEVVFNYILTSKYIDTDPADPEYVVDPLSSDVGK